MSVFSSSLTTSTVVHLEVGRGFERELQNFQPAARPREQQRTVELVILHIHVRSGSDQEFRRLDAVPLRGDQESGAAAVVLSLDVRAFFQEPRD